MQTRIIASLAGIALGLLAATFVGSDWGMTDTVRYAAFGVSGLALGNVASVLIDVFSGNTGAPTAGPNE